MKSEFQDWFVKQHGPRTKTGLPELADQQLRDMVEKGRVADRVLAGREIWDDLRQSALYAWTAARNVRFSQRPCNADKTRI